MGSAITNRTGVPNPLPLTNGGTNASTAQAAINTLAGGVTADNVLKGNGTNIVLGKVAMAADVSGTLPVGNGGTGATAAANSASGVVVLNGSAQLPAVSGALLTNLPSSGGVTSVYDTDAGTSYGTSQTTFLSVAKTITAGKTVLLIAAGYISVVTTESDHTMRLKHGITTVQTVLLGVGRGGAEYPYTLMAIVTGLSGSITFTVTAQGDTGNTALGNLAVLEF